MDTNQPFAGVELPDEIGSSQVSEDKSSQSTQEQADVKAALADLDKLEKFRYQGKEWTRKDLERAIMRQEDYTRKTQSLAKERKDFEDSQKFERNLQADLDIVKANPHMAAEFVKLYPAKYHKILSDYLRDTTQNQTQDRTATQQQRPTQDVEMLSRLNKLESFYNDQETKKNEVVINREIEKGLAKYPEVKKFEEIVIARVFEAYNQTGQVPTAEDWDKTFKNVQEQIQGALKDRYSEFVKKQQAANAKAKDVPAGGGTMGRAPAKFKSLKDVTAHAIQDLTRKG